MTTTQSHAQKDALLAALAWQIELGVDECIAEAPLNRFEEIAKAPAAKALASTAPVVLSTAKKAPLTGPAEDDLAHVVTEARQRASGAETLDQLRAVMEGFDGCPRKPLRKGHDHR